MRLQSRGRRRSPVRCICMLCVCVGSCTYVRACLCVRACLPVCVRACVYVCVFAAAPQYKRGHRKTASFGTILDVPKIVVTGTSSWGNQRGTSGAPRIGWLQCAWLRLWVAGCCAPMRSSRVCLKRLISEQRRIKKCANSWSDSAGYEATDAHQGGLTSSALLCVLRTDRRRILPLRYHYGDKSNCT